MIQPDIFITEMDKQLVTGKNDPRQIMIPWLPEKINFYSNETRFASYEILDLGEIKIPTGANIHSYSWEGILPGEGRKNNPLQRGKWQDPKKIQSVWSFWREYGTPLRLLIIGTPVNHDVYLEDYEITYSGAFGDYEYSISFIEARDVAISKDPAASTSFVGAPGSATARAASRPETRSSVETYISVSGDTLWTIAERFLGNGGRWPEIYNLNQLVLETAAKNNGHQSSFYGQLLLPGTRLEIKKK